MGMIRALGPALDGWLDLLDPGILPARHGPDEHIRGSNRKGIGIL
jgi:hypothetical protein